MLVGAGKGDRGEQEQAVVVGDSAGDGRCDEGVRRQRQKIAVLLEAPDREHSDPGTECPDVVGGGRGDERVHVISLRPTGAYDRRQGRECVGQRADLVGLAPTAEPAG